MSTMHFEIVFIHCYVEYVRENENQKKRKGKIVLLGYLCVDTNSISN